MRIDEAGLDMGRIGNITGNILASKAQLKATTTHRRKAQARGLARVEVQAPRSDGVLIRALAEALRNNPKRAASIRAAVRQALGQEEPKTAFDIFGSSLPDEAFAGVFDQPRQKRWRAVDL